jgi:hypothetical protein
MVLSMIVMRILNIFKKKGLNLQSRLGRIPSSRWLKNNNLRNREAYSQLKGLLKWKNRMLCCLIPLSKIHLANINQ